jgi:hypothetical protein
MRIRAKKRKEISRAGEGERDLVPFLCDNCLVLLLKNLRVHLLLRRFKRQAGCREADSLVRD